MRRVGVSTAAVAVSVLLFVVGCSSQPSGPERPKTIPVTVTVKYKGQPVEGAIVTFKPKSPDGKGATGRTDANGVAKMMTFTAGDGCLPGSYSVTIVKYETAQASGASAEESEEAYEAEMAKAMEGEEEEEAPPKSLLPEKYAKPETSGLTADVSEQNNEFTFELTD